MKIFSCIQFRVVCGYWCLLPLLHAVLTLISLLFIVFPLSEEKGTALNLIGPSLKGQQNGLAWHKSKHGALKNSFHNTSLRKLTTDVKALGVTAPSRWTPSGFICGLSNLGLGPSCRNWDQHYYKDKWQMFLLLLDQMNVVPQQKH